MRHPLPVPTRSALLKILKTLGNQSKAAEAFGVHRTTIRRWVDILGIKPADYRTGHSSNKTLEASDIPNIFELSKTLPAKAIADKYDVSVHSIYNVIKRKTWAWVQIEGDKP